MRREQKTGQAGCPCENTVETEGSKGARSIVPLEIAEKNGADSLLEKILHRDNLNAAYKRVKQNGGAAGVEGMMVDEMLWIQAWSERHQSIMKAKAYYDERYTSVVWTLI